MLGNFELISRLVLAAALGSVIGFERERLSWAAGLRTHMLVCVGSCLVMIVSAFGFADVLGPHVILDPSRVAAQVVSGVGFLGAGSIILRNEVVKGLTTAASLWTVAGVGLAVGCGLYVPAVAGTVTANRAVASPPGPAATGWVHGPVPAQVPNGETSCTSPRRSEARWLVTRTAKPSAISCA